MNKSNCKYLCIQIRIKLFGVHKAAEIEINHSVQDLHMQTDKLQQKKILDVCFLLDRFY